jgi:uncharacterized protein (TIGR02145 family)
MKMKRGLTFVMVLCISFLFLMSCKKSDSSSNNTSSGPTVTDVDGNVYHTITIGTQTWMVENLKVKHYRNGDPIMVAKDAPVFAPDTNAPDTTGYIYAYNNDAGNATVYGYLYNWYAIKDGRNVAPIGWHVPSDGEFEALVDKLGGNYLLLPNGDTTVGGEMKETGTAHWGVLGLPASNVGATNISGWTGLPGGLLYEGTFDDLRGSGVWWTTTTISGPNPLDEAYILVLTNYNKNADRAQSFKASACSIRCLNDKSK